MALAIFRSCLSCRFFPVFVVLSYSFIASSNVRVPKWNTKMKRVWTLLLCLYASPNVIVVLLLRLLCHCNVLQPTGSCYVMNLKSHEAVCACIRSVLFCCTGVLDLPAILPLPTIPSALIHKSAHTQHSLIFISMFFFLWPCQFWPSSLPVDDTRCPLWQQCMYYLIWLGLNSRPSH